MKAALNFLPSLTITASLMRRLGLGLVVLATAFATVLPAAQAAERDERGTQRQDKRDDDRGRSGRDRDEDRDREREKDRDDDRDRTKVQVSLTVPVAGAIFTAPATVTLTATAQSSQKNHPVTKVEFYQGTTLIGTATAAPYSATWSNAPAGRYSFTAKAYSDKAEKREGKDRDDKGKDDRDKKDKDVAVSAPVDIVVNALPTVTLTSPSANQVANAPGSFTLTANAADTDGTIAKVEFFNGAILIGTATAAPYSATWSNVPAGIYSLTAKATDDRGASTTSTGIPVIVNALPAVMLTSPTANAVMAAPATITVTASAADSDGTISKVEFYNGAILIGTATAAPYSITWSSVPSGSYSLTATATDNLGGQVTSAPVAITVDTPPTVTLTSPTAGAVGIAPASFTLTATAGDSDGSIAKVEFFQNGSLIGTATNPPYSLAWSNVSPGNYSLTASATDNLGIQTTSAAINVSVIANSPPTISLTSPTPNQSVKAPATITLTAAASDPDNNLAKVEFLQNGTLIATLLTPPYTATWSNVTQGTYQITAVATDAIGAQATSASITLTVTPAQASLYFIHPDHLNTPRLVTDEQNAIVWRNLPTTEPFGNTPPEEDPNATGHRFVLPLAFPGQYRDRESGLSYNFFRDYNPATGKYVQSDPIGLAGGINTYTYVNGNPVSKVDPRGLTATAAGAGVILFCLRYPQLCVNGVRAASAAAGAACVVAANKIKNWMLNEGENASPDATPTPPAPTPPETTPEKWSEWDARSNGWVPESEVESGTGVIYPGKGIVDRLPSRDWVKIWGGGGNSSGSNPGAGGNL